MGCVVQNSVRLGQRAQLCCTIAGSYVRAEVWKPGMPGRSLRGWLVLH